MKNLFGIIALIVAFQLSGQVDLAYQFEQYQKIYQPEKVFVHTDKNIYAAGERIWMSLYLVDGQSHVPVNRSQVIRIELRNPDDELMEVQKIRPTEGYAISQLDIEKPLGPGVYQLCAYTNHQRNNGEDYLFKKPIEIIAGIEAPNLSEGEVINVSLPQGKRSNQVNLLFYPEGGDCLVGMPCRVSFIAQNGLANPVSISGYIKDEEGQTLSAIKSNKYGVGTINYTPTKGGQYFAVDQSTNLEYDLPAAKASGYHLAIQQVKGASRITISANKTEGIKGATLVIHQRGSLLVEYPVAKKGSSMIVDVPSEDLGIGVFVAALLDSEGRPQAERLFYNAPRKENNVVSINSRATTYKKRKNVDLEIVVPDLLTQQDVLDSARLSMSVLPISSTGGPASDDIRTWLLLNSDVDFPIHHAPELLYNLEERVSDRWIDDFLLTRGWRRYNWDELSDITNDDLDYKLEKGVYLSGKMTVFDNPRKARPGKVTFTRVSNAFTEDVMTDEEGLFTFGPFDLQETIDIVLNGRYKLGKKKWQLDDISMTDHDFVKFEILEYERPKISPPLIVNIESDEEVASAAYLSSSKKALEIENSYEGLTVDFQDVEIKGKRLTRRAENIENATAYYGTPTNRLFAEEDEHAAVFSTVFNLLQRIPGVIVIGSRGSERVRIRGQSTILASAEPTYILDGTPSDVETMRILTPDEIDFIDVLKGPRAAAYGIRGANGVILVYTKRGASVIDKETPGILYTKMFGYHEAKEFAVFDYKGAGNQNRPDWRTTLHWNGDIRVGADGKAKEEILTSDMTGKYLIIVQGLTSTGQPLYGTGEFYIE